jgi:hypothetical protein
MSCPCECRKTNTVHHEGVQAGCKYGLLNIDLDTRIYMGHAVVQWLRALRYKPEGRGIDSRWCQNFTLT